MSNYTFPGSLWLVEYIGAGFNQVQATLKFDSPVSATISILCKLNIFQQLGF